MSTPVSLQCALSRADSALRVSYSIENRSGARLGVFNHVHRINADRTVHLSPDIAYTDVSGSTLHVRKAALPIPEGLLLTAYIPPDVSLIEPGGELSEIVTMPLPIQVYHPYKRDLLRGHVVADLPVEVTRVEVSIGVFPCGDDCRLIARIPTRPDILTVAPPDQAVRDQIVLTRSLDLDAPLTVLDYRASS